MRNYAYRRYTRAQALARSWTMRRIGLPEHTLKSAARWIARHRGRPRSACANALTIPRSLRAKEGQHFRLGG